MTQKDKIKILNDQSLEYINSNEYKNKCEKELMNKVDEKSPNYNFTEWYRNRLSKMHKEITESIFGG